MNMPPTSLGWDAGMMAVCPGRPAGLLLPVNLTVMDLTLLVTLTALLVGILAWVWHLRARRRIELEAERRTRQMTDLIEQAQGVLWEAEVVLETDDWVWHMRLHPSAFCRQLFRGRAPEPGVDLWIDFEIDTREQMNRRGRDALERGLPGYAQEFRAVRDGRTYWLHENVSITRLAADRFRLVGLVTDLTPQREAEAARRQSEQTVERILAHAQCMLWRATVLEENGVLTWPHFDMPQSRLSELLFGTHRAFLPQRGFWGDLSMPEQAEMDERSDQAIRGGAPGYEQQFRAITPAGRTFWLDERVSIARVGERLWSLVGVVTDITPQVEAEASRRRTETTLAHLLERAESMIWQGRVHRQPDGQLLWSLFIPPSQLHRRIFRREPEGDRGFAWQEQGVPEHAEMAERAFRAITEGAAGYDQVFHVIRPTGDIWLNETTTISPTGPGSWDLVGIVTDITARHRAEEAWQVSQARLRSLLDGAECMIWEADVRVRPDERLAWDQYIPPSALYRRIFGDPSATPPRLRWDELVIPEYPEMVARTLAAVKAKAGGYTQEFHVVQADGELWLRETVTMQAVDENRFRMAGVITDITVQHRAEEARQKSELRLTTLLEQADCMVWQGEVRRLTPDDYQWRLFTPRSRLFRKLFGRDPDGDCHFDWAGRVPEFPEIRRRSRQALDSGQPGYEQVFHLDNPAGAIWLNEKVNIKPVGPGHWELIGIITDITAQHQAEEARQASEQRLGELLSRADCLVWESTVELQPEGWIWGRKIQPSLFYQRLTGAPLPPDTEAMWPESHVPERAEMDRRCREAILGGRPGYDQVFRFVKRDGDTAWVSENVTIQRLDEKHYWLVGVAVDVTAQRLSEAARQASEERLLNILARADCLLWEATAELTADDWRWEFRIQPSLLCRRLYGTERPTVMDGLWRKFEIPERREMNARCREAMAGGRPGYDQIFHIVQPDGSVTWIRENVTIRPIGDQRYSLVGVAVDITGQRGAEEALAAEKERLAVTLRAMSEAVVTTDVTGCIQFMNPAAATLTGRDTAACIGRPVQEVCVLENIRTGAPVEVPVARVALGDIVADLPAQTRLVTADGGRRVVEGCCAPIHAADSRVTGTVLVFRDVTDQERLEQELVRATRLESVGVLAGGIAHDFNNILTAIMGNLALAQLDLVPESPVAGSVRAAEKAALRARDLTQQLLTFAKGGEPVRAAIQLEAIVREMTAFALHGSHVKAHYDLAPDLWPADADKGQIGRVVQNLVINAVQAMPRGGTLQIMARNDPHAGADQPGLAPGNYIQIAITDTGEGIKPDNLARIFDPYFTTKQTGTGLGLAAVYSIIRKHHGHIEVESQVGQGTTFRFWLPALRGGAATPADTRAPWAGSGENPLRGRVLFMDDEQIIRDMAVSLLQRFGLTVDCAEHGAEAVEKYRAALAAGQRYDLVIMDLTVPGGMGGLAALGELRKLDPQVNAVVSSGYSSDPVLARYREHGFAAVVAKPYEVGEIARVLREVLPGV